MKLTRSPVLLYRTRPNNKRQHFPHTLQHWPFESCIPPRVIETVPKLPDNPERILDAPSVINDFYPHALDYTNGHLATCLGGIPYTWNKFNSQTTRHHLPDESYSATCVKLSACGSYLFVGSRRGATTSLTHYNLDTDTPLRTINDISYHKPTCISQGEGNLVYLSNLSSLGMVSILDLSARDAKIGRFGAHYDGVITISANPTSHSTYIATGTQANEATIWDLTNLERPVMTINHNSAVKGIAWHPHFASCIATGGGGACRKIIVTDTITRKRLVEHDTGAQISGLSWSEDGRYLISTHGFSHDGIQVFKYRPGQGLTNIHNHTKAHKGRVLDQVHDKGDLVTLSADQTIKIWDYSPLTSPCTAVSEKARSKGKLISRTIR